jgi:hypothetical protein
MCVLSLCAKDPIGEISSVVLIYTRVNIAVFDSWENVITEVFPLGGTAWGDDMNLGRIVMTLEI